MKCRKFVFAAAGLTVLVLLVIVVALFALSPSGSAGRASVALLIVTNDALGQKFAVLRFTNASPVAVVGIGHSVDYKTTDGWLTHQPVPGVVNADLQSYAMLSSLQSREVSVRFPTNGTWRLRIRYHEQARGVKGAFARIRDIADSILTQGKTKSYTGQIYLAETSEISN